MRARAEKRHAQTVRREYLDEHPLCEVGARLCEGRASQVHHKLRRSQGGADTEDNFLSCCVICHDLIHREPALAYRNGWLLKSWDLVP